MYTATIRLFFAVVVALTNVAHVSAISKHPIVIVMQFDGFRHDFVDKDTTPTMHKLIRESATWAIVKPVFPSRKAVNDSTIATGLYPAEHGVVGECYLERPGKNGTNYTIRAPQCHTFYQYQQNTAVVPIWVENEKKGDNRLSGTVIWPGAEFNYQNNDSPRFNIFDTWTNIDEEFLPTMQNWIGSDCNLVMGNFGSLNTILQKNGLKSNEGQTKINKIDKIIKNVIEWIDKQNEETKKKINLIIIGGHGMESVKYQNIIFLDELFKSIVCNSCKNRIAMGANALVVPAEDEFEHAYLTLKKKSQNSMSFSVYKHNEILPDWHIKEARVLQDSIFLKADFGYGFLNHIYEKSLNLDQNEVGINGYYVGDSDDNSSMNTIVIGWGPKFKKGHKAPTLNMIEIHPLLKHLLELWGETSPIQPDRNISNNVKDMLV